MIQKLKESINIQDAMDNLAAVSGINLDNLPPIGIGRKNRIVTDTEEMGPNEVEWLTGEGSEAVLEILDLTYRSIHQYLVSLYDNPEMNWDNEKSRKGIAAMMDLVAESANKITSFLELRLGHPLELKVTERNDFKALHYFYYSRFSKRFKGEIEGDEAWREEWSENEDAALLDISKTGLKDFETVKRDQEYELFYIRNEDGKPYFNPELLRNIRLTCFESPDAETFEEDPLLKVRSMQDRDLLSSAGQILADCQAEIADFYAIAHKLGDNELGKSLSMAIIALFLTANPRHLIQNTIGKSCLQYYSDFHRFLRRSMKTAEYQKLIAYPPDKEDRVSHLLLFLTNSLSKAFFYRMGGVKQEAIGLVHRTMRKGEEIKQKGRSVLLKGETLWNQFLLDDEKLRTYLSQFPNGPLFKILDVIREEHEEDAIVPFDPIGQENLPSRLYEISRREKKIDVLRIPSPTKQALINKAEVIDEFRSFLRSYSQGSGRKKKHLMINLQDRTSWKEYARSRALENLSKSAEMSQQFFIATFPKSTDFYHQNNEYANLNSAADFMEALKGQISEEAGFYFSMSIKEILHFTEVVLPLIHEHFFHSKNSLTRKNREDFIEIYMQFLVLKCIDLVEPDSISFTCKDAIDTGAAAQGTFFGFLQLLDGGLAQKEDQDFLRWLLYVPALFIRERPIDPEQFHRTISCLERMEGEMMERGSQIIKAFSELYHAQTFKTLKVKHG